jgi:hypothetical protein
MDYIHRSFSNLEVQEMVPCLCSECAPSGEPYFYAYSDLQKARKKNLRDIQCRQSFESVPVEQLLGGIEGLSKEPPGIRQKEGKDSNPGPIRTQSIRIFLASPGDLMEERQAIDRFVSKENRRLHPDTFLDLVMWEDQIQSFDQQRIQDVFNEQLEECDIVLCLFFTKVGKFTKEEFDLAYARLKQGQNPHYLYVYFKSGSVDIDDIDEEILKIRKLKQEIANAEQIFHTFTSQDDLLLQLRNQLDLVLPKLTTPH